MTLELATPSAALGALVGLVPLAVAVARLRRARKVRRALDLAEPGAAAKLARPLALACAFGLLGLAAAQPSIRRQHERVARSDAELVVVLDSSRSMLAAAGPNEPARYQRAVAFAHRLHAALPQVPMGISSLTNRLLPYLFPTSDGRAYDLVLDQAYGIERPPPALTVDRWVTTFDPLVEVAKRRFFSPGARRRVLVVLSDAESRDFDVGDVLRRLRRSGTEPVVVRFWRPGERIFVDGRAVGSYHAVQSRELAVLHAAGWPAFDESRLGAALDRVREAIGSGPTVHVGYERRETSVAPVIATIAFAPLLLLLVPAGWLPALRPARLRRRPVGGVSASPSAGA